MIEPRRHQEGGVIEAGGARRRRAWRRAGARSRSGRRRPACRDGRERGGAFELGRDQAARDRSPRARPCRARSARSCRCAAACGWRRSESRRDWVRPWALYWRFALANTTGSAARERSFRGARMRRIAAAMAYAATRRHIGISCRISRGSDHVAEPPADRPVQDRASDRARADGGRDRIAKLAIAVCGGGRARLAAGRDHRRGEDARRRSRRSAPRPSKPINVNFFCHKPPVLNNAREHAWRERLKPYYDELGIDPARRCRRATARRSMPRSAPRSRS